MRSVARRANAACSEIFHRAMVVVMSVRAWAEDATWGTAVQNPGLLRCSEYTIFSFPLRFTRSTSTGACVFVGEVLGIVSDVSRTIALVPPSLPSPAAFAFPPPSWRPSLHGVARVLDCNLLRRCFIRSAPVLSMIRTVSFPGRNFSVLENVLVSHISPWCWRDFHWNRCKQPTQLPNHVRVWKPP